MGLATLTGECGCSEAQLDNDFWVVIAYAKYNEESQEFKPETGLHATHLERSSSGL